MNDTTCKQCGHPEALHYLTPSHSTRCLAAWSTVSDRGVIGMQQDHRCACEGFEAGVYTPPETRKGRARREIAERLDAAIKDLLAERNKRLAETPVARPEPQDVPLSSEESAPATQAKAVCPECNGQLTHPVYDDSCPLCLGAQTVLVTLTPEGIFLSRAADLPDNPNRAELLALLGVTE